MQGHNIKSIWGCLVNKWSTKTNFTERYAHTPHSVTRSTHKGEIKYILFNFHFLCKDKSFLSKMSRHKRSCTHCVGKSHRKTLKIFLHNHLYYNFYYYYYKLICWINIIIIIININISNHQSKNANKYVYNCRRSSI